jgi:hypothetical protein
MKRVWKNGEGSVIYFLLRLHIHYLLRTDIAFEQTLYHAMFSILGFLLCESTQRE